MRPPLRTPFFDGSGSPDGPVVVKKLGNLDRIWALFFSNQEAAVAAVAPDPSTALDNSGQTAADIEDLRRLISSLDVASAVTGGASGTDPVGNIFTGGLNTTIGAVVVPPTGFSGSYALVALTGQAAGIGTTNIQHAAAVLPAGLYQVSVNLESTTSGTGNVAVTLGWKTPAGNVHAPVVVSFALTSLGTVVSAFTQLRTDGATNLTYATSDSGTGAYALDISVVRIA